MKNLTIILVFLSVTCLGQKGEFQFNWNPANEWTNEGSELCGFGVGLITGHTSGYILHDHLNVKYGYEIGGIATPLVVGSLREFTQKDGGYKNRFFWNMLGGSVSAVVNRAVQKKYGLSEIDRLLNRSITHIKRYEKTEKIKYITKVNICFVKILYELDTKLVIGSDAYYRLLKVATFLQNNGYNTEILKVKLSAAIIEIV